MHYEDLTTIEPPQPPEVVLSANARHSILIRDLDPDQIVTLIRNAGPSDFKRDSESGYLVYHAGSLRVVARPEGNAIVVLTTIRTDELSPPDGQ